MANGRRFGCVTGLVRDSACCLSASTLACARRRPVITLPAIRTASGSCCGRRSWFPKELLTSTMTGLPSGGMESRTWCRAPAPGSTISVRPSTWTDGQRSNERFVDSGPASSRSSESRFTGRSSHCSRARMARPRAHSGAGCRTAAGDDPRGARVRGSQPERPQRQLQLRGDAGRVQGTAARGAKSRAGG